LRISGVELVEVSREQLRRRISGLATATASPSQRSASTTSLACSVSHRGDLSARALATLLILAGGLACAYGALILASIGTSDTATGRLSPTG
jgi:hypothetical protein